MPVEIAKAATDWLPDQPLAALFSVYLPVSTLMATKQVPAPIYPVRNEDGASAGKPAKTRAFGDRVAPLCCVYRGINCGTATQQCKARTLASGARSSGASPPRLPRLLICAGLLLLRFGVLPPPDTLAGRRQRTDHAGYCLLGCCSSVSLAHSTAVLPLALFAAKNRITGRLQRGPEKQATARNGRPDCSPY